MLTEDFFPYLNVAAFFIFPSVLSSIYQELAVSLACFLTAAGFNPCRSSQTSDLSTVADGYKALGEEV